jgi:hypothetical protein
MTRHPTFGAILSVDWAGGSAYEVIGQVRDIDGPSVGRNVIEVPADHDLPDNYIKKFSGVSNAGQLSFALNLDPNDDVHIGQANGSGFLGSFEDTYNGSINPTWRMQSPGLTGGTATWTFRGIVTDMSINMGAVEGSMEADVTVEIDGKPTFAVS